MFSFTLKYAHFLIFFLLFFLFDCFHGDGDDGDDGGGGSHVQLFFYLVDFGFVRSFIVNKFFLLDLHLLKFCLFLIVIVKKYISWRVG